MSEPAKKVLITGATGLVGRHLSLKLFSEGYQIIALSRNAEAAKKSLGIPCQVFEWNPTESLPPSEAFNGVSVIVHLAGENIAEGRWTPSRKKRLYDSRIKSAQNLIAGLKKSGTTGVTFIGASAVGYYGNRGEEILSEDSAPGKGFLSDLCRDWEKETLNPPPGITRALVLRLGVVMAQEGGMLAKVSPLFRKGFGGRLGKGLQYMSWIHIQDLIPLITFCIDKKEIRGIVNATSPHPVTNRVFTETLNSTVKSRACLPALQKPLECVLGEMAQVLFFSQRALPKKITQAGFSFRFPELKPALENLLGTQGEHKLVFKTWLPNTLEQTYGYFSIEKHLEDITPPWLNFKVVGKTTAQIQSGTEINYRLSLHGLPLRWTSIIEKWEPPQLFTDLQKKGPYKKWHHTHTFQAVQKGTLMTDTVLFSLPMGKLGEFFAGDYVTNDVNKIFAYRNIKIREAFGSS